MSGAYSVIIPTLWKSNVILDNVLHLSKSSFVKEIIIISNTKERKKLQKKVGKIAKINIKHNGRNNFVNKSWNMGYEISSSENLCFCNDDVKFDVNRTFNFLSSITLSNRGIIGSPPVGSSVSGPVHLAGCKNMPIDYGCLFFINKSNYTFIPEKIKIWFGDVWLFENCSKRYIIKNINVSGEKSATSNSFRSDYWSSDLWAWRRDLKPLIDSNNHVELLIKKAIARAKCFRYKHDVTAFFTYLKSILKKYTNY
jgi:hypothetical protein